ncbi:hypothetical protein [Streptomyces eurythermus]|uniref:hypothetical protein n=1 Tax=Streptomyces eurythermus TaxID=42237 RepID=UPI0033F7D053
MVADKAVCQPVADALSETGAVKPAASVERSAVAEDRSGVMVRVRLASYSGEGAAEIMAGLAKAMRKCTASKGRAVTAGSTSAWLRTTAIWAAPSA